MASTRAHRAPRFGRSPLGAALLWAVSSGLLGPAAEALAEDPDSTVDHGALPELSGPFETGPQVTAACLGCHTEAGRQVQATTHWSWRFVHPETGQVLGKRFVVNNFCGPVRTNEPRCASCHNGYGTDALLRGETSTHGASGLGPRAEARVDCLSCHDTTGTYVKSPTRSGQVLQEETTVHGETFEPPDLTAVAQSVGEPTLKACGSCHFNGGGGDGSKHGDLDSSLLDAPHALSVHMSEEGGGFACQTCHVTRGHEMAGGRYAMSARDRAGTGAPGLRRHAATCESCHGTDPHERGGPFIALTLDRHADRVACQTCHIPRIARGGVMTKVWWDWSKAGRLTEDGERIHETNAAGRTTYWSRWGEIRWQEDFRPSYAWFDGVTRYARPGQSIDTSTVVALNRFGGDAEDPDARIWPFKIMRGRIPYDAGRDELVLMHLFGRDGTAFWRNLDWAPAIEAAMKGADHPFSGEVGFVDTKMYWPVTHMVAPAEASVTCGDCHRRPSIMAGIDDVYLPGRDAHGLLDLAGFGALALTGVLILGHAALRLVFWSRRTRRRR